MNLEMIQIAHWATSRSGLLRRRRSGTRRHDDDDDDDDDDDEPRVLDQSRSAVAMRLLLREALLDGVMRVRLADVVCATNFAQFLVPASVRVSATSSREDWIRFLEWLDRFYSRPARDDEEDYDHVSISSNTSNTAEDDHHKPARTPKARTTHCATSPTSSPTTSATSHTSACVIALPSMGRDGQFPHRLDPAQLLQPGTVHCSAAERATVLLVLLRALGLRARLVLDLGKPHLAWCEVWLHAARGDLPGWVYVNPWSQPPQFGSAADCKERFELLVAISVCPPHTDPLDPRPSTPKPLASASSHTRDSSATHKHHHHHHQHLNQYRRGPLRAPGFASPPTPVTAHSSAADAVTSSPCSPFFQSASVATTSAAPLCSLADTSATAADFAPPLPPLRCVVEAHNTTAAVLEGDERPGPTTEVHNVSASYVRAAQPWGAHNGPVLYSDESLDELFQTVALMSNAELVEGLLKAGEEFPPPEPLPDCDSDDNASSDAEEVVPGWWEWFERRARQLALGMRPSAEAAAVVGGVGLCWLLVAALYRRRVV